MAEVDDPYPGALGCSMKSLGSGLVKLGQDFTDDLRCLMGGQWLPTFRLGDL
jgi:hypothetical protein